MREIKFRAWSKSEKEMFSHNVLKSAGDGLSKLGKMIGQDVPGGLLLPIDDRDLVFMQYTGLKDKNGTEIYEGDVVCCLWEDEKFIVEWDEIGTGYLFHNVNDKKRTHGIDYYEFEDMCASLGFEVVGNRFEHPHLLKEGVQA